MDQQAIQTILRLYFGEDLSNLKFQKFGSGLIHQTFLIDLNNRNFILQGFNSNVFRFPDRIEKNLNLVKDSGDLSLLPFHLPLPIRTLDGESLISFESKLFRLFDFVDGKTLQQIQTPNQAKLASEAYGAFSRWADSFSLEGFEETIPNFHRLDMRYERLLEVSRQAKVLNPAEKEILEFYLQQKELVDRYVNVCGKIPFRLTHNDTKINNLIYSEDLSKVKAVVDLDTIMPGYLLYDFGDLVRTVASAEEEISQNWDNQRLILSVFEKLLEGYWSAAGNWMMPTESRSLLLGGEVMTALMGIRFFTDHLEGNIYYQVEYPLQNLHRAKNQMLLLRSMQNLKPDLQAIFSKVTGVPVK